MFKMLLLLISILAIVHIVLAKPPSGFYPTSAVGKPKREAGETAKMPQQDCVEQCKRAGSAMNCDNFCTVLTPMERHVSPLLDADCVNKCNGGEVNAQNPLKAECEQQCPYKEPSPVMAKRQNANTNANSNDAEPGCKTECHATEDGRGRECKTTCNGKLPGSGRVTGQLDRACVEQCNGGGAFPTKLEELKPECEQKCAFKGSANQVYQLKKTEFSSKEACMEYCQEKSLGQCDEKCRHTFSGMVQG